MNKPLDAQRRPMVQSKQHDKYLIVSLSVPEDGWRAPLSKYLGAGLHTCVYPWCFLRSYRAIPFPIWHRILRWFGPGSGLPSPFSGSDEVNIGYRSGLWRGVRKGSREGYAGVGPAALPESLKPGRVLTSRGRPLKAWSNGRPYVLDLSEVRSWLTDQNSLVVGRQGGGGS